MTEADRRSLVDRLTTQRDLLARLEGLGERQSMLVEQEQTDTLLALIAERQHIVDEIVELGRGLDDELADIDVHPDPAVQAVREQVEAAARRIAARDNAHRGVLEARRRELTQEMAGVEKGRSAMAAYSARDGSARFKDTEA
ncbi:MAG: flagellar protein FliT [Phycisphaerales bacterium]